MHQIGSRRVSPYETAVAIPACEDTGPPVRWRFKDLGVRDKVDVLLLTLNFLNAPIHGTFLEH